MGEFERSEKRLAENEPTLNKLKNVENSEQRAESIEQKPVLKSKLLMQKGKQKKPPLRKRSVGKRF